MISQRGRSDVNLVDFHNIFNSNKTRLFLVFSIIKRELGGPPPENVNVKH